MSLDRKFDAADAALARMARGKERELLRAYAATLNEIRPMIAKAYEVSGGSYVEMQKYNRLVNLEKNIIKEVAKLTSKSAVTIKGSIAQQFAESYYRTGFAVETEATARLGFGMLNPKVIEAAIDNPLDRVGFLQRNRDNQSRLARQLKEQLAQGLIRGEAYQDVAARIKERMDVGAENVLRIVRTENHRAQVKGRLSGLDQAEDAGVVFVRIWDATLDDATRETHQDMDGQEANEDGLFDLDGDLVEGPGLTGDPAEDINCRCSVRAEIKDYGPEVRRRRLTGEEYDEAVAREAEEAAREGRDPRPVSKSAIEDYQTYGEWREARIKG